jgi:hypothetical protein
MTRRGVYNVFSLDVLANWKATEDRGEAHILHVERGVLTGHWIEWGVEVMVPCPFRFLLKLFFVFWSVLSPLFANGVYEQFSTLFEGSKNAVGFFS